MIRNTRSAEGMMRISGLLSASLLLAITARAQNRDQGEGQKLEESQRRAQLRDPRTFRRLEVSGDEVAEKVRKLTTELHWHKSLSSALASARRQGKPVVWIQALGDLDGFL